MALLMFDGFESAPTLRNGMSVGAGTLSAATGRDGVGRAITGTSGGYLIVPLPNPTTLVLGLGLKPQSAALSGAPGLGEAVYLLGDSGATTHLSISLTVDGRWILRRAAGAGTILATAAASITVDAWGYLEVKATINDTTGICIVKWNGAEVINFTGDTKNAGTLTTFSTVHIPASTSRYTSDDLYICDTTGSAPYNDFLGERVIRGIRPSGNGTNSQWVGSDGNSTDNYALVDEYPFNTTDYVTSAVAADRDTYAFSDVSGLATVDAVQTYAYVAKTDAGARNIKLLTRSTGGTLLTSPSLPLSTTYAVVQDTIRMAGPDSGWSQAVVNACEYGIENV